jgi:hypothetical protein
MREKVIQILKELNLYIEKKVSIIFQWTLDSSRLQRSLSDIYGLRLTQCHCRYAQGQTT